MRSMKGKGICFRDGIRDGIPIGLAYFSVSFGVGVVARAKGISALLALLMSATNLTSAGQAAGIEVISQRIIAAGADGAFTLAVAGELVLTQAVINLRYALMGLTLSQRLSPRFGIAHRLLASASITDEIFAVAVSRQGELEPGYWYGLSGVPFLCWSAGTLCGALAGDILPALLSDALGIALYGMFLAIVIPPARENRGVCWAVLIASATSCLFAFLPVLSSISFGFRVILCSLASAALCAALFPVQEKEDEV